MKKYKKKAQKKAIIKINKQKANKIMYYIVIKKQGTLIKLGSHALFLIIT